MLKSRNSVLALAIGTAVGLAGCGGGGSSGASPTASSSSLTSGVITGFGSVFVNGIEYETGGSSITLDSSPGIEGALQVGMRVTLRGSVNPDGVTGTATSIDYRDEVEGIVQSNDFATNGTLTVMGLSVHIDTTTFFESTVAGVTGFDTIQVGNIVEVSGFRIDNSTIQATRIEVKQASHGGEEIEVKGVISALDNANSTFVVGGLSVDFSSALLENIPGGVLADGLFVEVKSTAGIDGSGNLIASKVELEGDGDTGIDGQDGEEVKLSGPIGSGSTSTLFTLSGTTVRVTSNTRFENGSSASIVDGAVVKVEGTLNAQGELVAEEVEFGEPAETEIKATIESVDPAAQPATLTLMGLTVTVNANTMFRDDRDTNPVRFFGVDDLNAGDRIEIDLFKNDQTGALVALKIQREDGAGPGRLEGVVESAPFPGQITVSGVSVDISATGSAPVVGDKVKISGNYDVGTGILVADSLAIDI